MTDQTPQQPVPTITENRNLAVFGSQTALQSRLAVDVSTEDMAAIGVSRAEQALATAMKEARSAALRATNELRDARRKLGEYLAAYGATTIYNREPIRAHVDALVAALIPFHPEAAFAFEASSYSIANGKIESILVVTTKPDTACVRRTYTDSLPAEVIDMHTAITRAEEAQETANREVSRIRSAMANIDKLERKAKATIARSMISRTEDGAALVRDIDTMDINVENLIDDLSS